jgi:hypothetical protein
MSRVRLTCAHLGAGSPFYRPDDRSGSVHFMPRPRLFINLYVLPPGAGGSYQPGTGSDEWMPEAILDTGAPLSLFPVPVWRPFAAAVRWLDRDDNWLPAAWTPAWFLTADDPAAPKQAVLGLRTRLLDNRQLRCEATADDPAGQRWWLEDA